MVANGYSVYVQGAATKGDVRKTFHWGFTTATQYKDCQEEADNGRARKDRDPARRAGGIGHQGGAIRQGGVGLTFMVK